VIPFFIGLWNKQSKFGGLQTRPTTQQYGQKFKQGVN